MSLESLENGRNFAKKYPTLGDSLFGAEFCVRDILYPSLSFEEVTKKIPMKWVKTTKEGSLLALKELNLLLEEDQFPWNAITSSANRHFDTEQEVRDWVVQIRDIFQEEL